MKIKTIYENFSDYSEEEVNAALSKLTDDDMNLIRLKYGEDLKNPVTSPDFISKKYTSFYSRLLPKIRKMLADPNYKPKSYRSRTKKNDELSLANSSDSPDIVNDLNDTITPNKPMTKLITNEEYIKMLEFFDNPLFDQILTSFEFKERLILTLVLGQLDKENPKYYAIEAIAEFLDMDIEEVRSVIVDGLLAYKDSLSNYIDVAMNNITKQKIK